MQTANVVPLIINSTKKSHFQHTLNFNVVSDIFG